VLSNTNDISAVSLPVIERNTTNHLTLQYLTNPIYKKEDFKQNNKITDSISIDKTQCSFYKKRIIATTKEMLKGEYPSKHLEKIHKEYIQSLIHHFKKVDETELIQKEYNDLDISPAPAPASEQAPAPAPQQLNNEIMMKKSKSISIDNFVTKKVIKFQKTIPVPQKKVLNIQTPEHKIKGIPPKKLKENI